ncbi:hypothetical protein HLX14_004157 [Escherichia coli]|uniref:hypothetical protein n=1 Tax=Edwardsiella TaxID=635 RepID=UPI00090060C8|nr:MULTISPECIES: hypothetical protein [Edwardsiella]EFP0183676.1 hypothetical protein [Escherichia coli]EGA8339093.1 hypothetical protein [Salmonella enterica subsp. enterica serovar Saintpaul]EKG9744405.1 hypothetical protein [Salmonella enterica]EKS7763305.1 hypothetical protein [Edwardsiella ictaluri]EKS7789720.1 hypothetical protein [Edwardsiella ictaluri]
MIKEELSSNEAQDGMRHAGYAQCVFILAQSLIFPNLGSIGALIAALCGMMPWVIRTAKQDQLQAFCMVVASLCLATAYGKLCEVIISIAQGV